MTSAAKAAILYPVDYGSVPWLAYGITRGNQDSELRLRDSRSDSTAAWPHRSFPA